MIKSNNTEFGFYGTIKLNYKLQDKTTSRVYDLVAKRVIKEFYVTEEVAINFLDSRMGRHLADNFTFFIKKQVDKNIDSYPSDKLKSFFDWFKEAWIKFEKILDFILGL